MTSATAPSNRYVLFAARNTYAMIVHALLEEIGADHELHRVELFSDTPDPRFAAVSPLLRVPVLVGPDGPVFESGAIAQYLAERHPEAELGIPVGDPRRGRFLQWLHYLSSTLQPEVLIQYHPEFYFDDEDDRRRLKAASMRRLAKALDVIETGLDPGPFFFGERRSVCDYCLAMQAVWPPIFPSSISDYPKIERLTRAITARPAVRRALIMHEETWAGAS